MTIEDHYRAAEHLVERADAQLERLLEAGRRGYDDDDNLTPAGLKLAALLVSVQYSAAQVHATLATVTTP